MNDNLRRCCNCRFYDDVDVRCKLNPPVYAGRVRDEYGDRVQHWAQPIVDTAWAERCGQWEAADEDQTDGERYAQIMSLIQADNGNHSEKPNGSRREAAAEIERLNREVSILIAECQRQQDLLVNGVTLTDAEREALEFAVAHGETVDAAWRYALRGLLERLGGGK